MSITASVSLTVFQEPTPLLLVAPEQQMRVCVSAPDGEERGAAAWRRTAARIIRSAASENLSLQAATEERKAQNLQP